MPAVTVSDVTVLPWVPEPGDTAWASEMAEAMLEGDGEDDEFEVITGSFDPPGARFLDLVEVMRRLRRDCAWTREQTHVSLAPYLAEESGETLEAIERLPLSYGPLTFYDLFVWVRHKLYEQDRNFQRFHIARIAEREALKASADKSGKAD